MQTNGSKKEAKLGVDTGSVLGEVFNLRKIIAVATQKLGAQGEPLRLAMDRHLSGDYDGAISAVAGMPSGDAESEQEQAERWAREYEGGAAWAMLFSNERAEQAEAMLPIVREARAFRAPIDRAFVVSRGENGSLRATLYDSDIELVRHRRLRDMRVPFSDEEAYAIAADAEAAFRRCMASPPPVAIRTETGYGYGARPSLLEVPPGVADEVEAHRETLLELEESKRYVAVLEARLTRRADAKGATQELDNARAMLTSLGAYTDDSKPLAEVIAWMHADMAQRLKVATEARDSLTEAEAMRWVIAKIPKDHREEFMARELMRAWNHDAPPEVRSASTEDSDGNEEQ